MIPKLRRTMGMYSIVERIREGEWLEIHSGGICHRSSHHPSARKHHSGTCTAVTYFATILQVNETHIEFFSNEYLKRSCWVCIDSHHLDHSSWLGIQSYAVTYCLHSTSQNWSFSKIYSRCYAMCGIVFMIGKLYSTCAVSPHMQHNHCFKFEMLSTGWPNRVPQLLGCTDRVKQRMVTV